VLLPSIKQNYDLLFYRYSIDDFLESIDLLFFRQEYPSGIPLVSTLKAAVSDATFD